MMWEGEVNGERGIRKAGEKRAAVMSGAVQDAAAVLGKRT